MANDTPNTGDALEPSQVPEAIGSGGSTVAPVVPDPRTSEDGITVTEPNDTALWLETYGSTVGAVVTPHPLRVEAESILGSGFEGVKIAIQDRIPYSEPTKRPPTAQVVRNEPETGSRNLWIASTVVGVGGSPPEGGF